jgi:hypothetical protein
MLEFSSADKMNEISGLTDELFKHVLYDEEPLFVSDDATIWDVCMSGIEEILERCRKYYGVPVTLEDTQQPLWQLLRMLDQRRTAAKSASV